MLGTEWVYVAVGVLLCAHLLMLLYAYRANRSDSAFDAEPVDSSSGDTGRAGIGHEESGHGDSDDPSGETVCRCPECGTDNDTAYRFCRQCAAELPATNLHIEHPGRQQQPY